MLLSRETLGSIEVKSATVRCPNNYKLISASGNALIGSATMASTNLKRSGADGSEWRREKKKMKDV